MKCLKTIEGKVMESRYPDDVAAKLVATGKYAYCPKNEWKRDVRDAKRESSKNAKIKGNHHEEKKTDTKQN